MTARQQLFSVLLFIAVAVGSWFLLNQFLGHEIKPLGIGSRAPVFQATHLNEEKTSASLGDYKGDVVMLNIWATWCAPCRAEMPSMQRLHEEYQDKGLRIVAVSIDDEFSERNIKSFVEDFGITFEILHNPDGDIQRIYQTTGVPETIVIGRDGVIRNKVSGAVDWYSDSNRKLIERLLAP